VKEVLFRKVISVGEEVSSTAVKADAWHHRSDALTSIAAFAGISVALVGGPGWEAADDWAALVAAVIIVVNAVALLKPAVDDLMDRRPDTELLARVSAAAMATPDVRAIEKLRLRKVGFGYHVDLHVQTDPAMSLHDAHVLSGRVKGAIRTAVPVVHGVLIHMEPHEM
jgi:cation diffusion facilitator family transporter